MQVALQNLEAFETEAVDYIVTLCASCGSHLKNNLPGLVQAYAPDKARAFARKIIPFSQFMNQVVGVDQRSGQGRKIAFHSPCHLGRGLGVKEDPRQLIARSGNIYLKTREEETCCGFGGSFSVNFPAVSREILTRKLADVESSGADLLVTECPGCVMQLRGGAVQQGRNIRVMHLSELFDA